MSKELEIHWGSAHLWWVVVVLSIMAGGLSLYRLWCIRKNLRILNKSVHNRSFLKHASWASYCIKILLWNIAFVFLAVTLLHPQWDNIEEKVPQEGRDLFIALDISRSMLAQDVKPSRLEYAKAKIRGLVNALSCERVGLILFSGSSFISCPLTKDYGAFFMFLNQIDVESISSGTTALDAAMTQAMQAFEQGPPRKNKLLVMVTDGEDFSPTMAATKEKARALGLTIFALGIGTSQGAPIPLYDEFGSPHGHQKDSKGAIVISKLNDDMLNRLTADLHGKYIQATSDDRDIKELVNQLAVFEKEKFEDRSVEHYQEQYPWFLAVTFSALLLEWLL